MSRDEAIDLAERISRELGTNQLAWRLDNGIWVVWLTIQVYVWNRTDWLENRDTILLKNKVPAL